MPRKPQKILEISGPTWMGGLSIQKFMSLNGVFEKATNFNPFEESGFWIPTIAGIRRGTNKINKEIKHFVDYTNIYDSNRAYLYGFCNNNEVFAINTITPFTVTSESNKISGVTKVQGAIRYKDKILYTNETLVLTGAIPLTSGNQSTILTGLLTTSTTAGYEHIMVVGPDRNVYGTNRNHIFRITTVATTTGNSSQYLSFEDGVITRDVLNDGRYLVVLGDDNKNPSSITGNPQGAHRCFVAFWYPNNQDLSQIYEFQDGQLYSGEIIEDEVIIFGADNIYTCSLTRRPKVLMPLRNNPIISSSNLVKPAATIKQGNNIVLWAIGNIIYGYGRPHNFTKKILFQLNTESNSDNVSAMYSAYNPSNEINLWASSDGNRLYDYGNDTVRNTSTARLVGIDLKTPYEFAFGKVIFRDILTSGQSFSLKIQTGNAARTILNTKTVSFANNGAVASAILYPKVSGTAASDTYMFENITDFEMVNIGGIEVQRVEIWGYPVEVSEVTGF